MPRVYKPKHISKRDHKTINQTTVFYEKMCISVKHTYRLSKVLQSKVRKNLNIEVHLLPTYNVYLCSERWLIKI